METVLAGICYEICREVISHKEEVTTDFYHALHFAVRALVGRELLLRLIACWISALKRAKQMFLVLCQK